MTTHAITAKPAGNKFTRFFSGIWGELKKVVWLSRKEAAYLTMIVLVVSVIAGIVLYGCDYGFSTLIDNFIIK